MLTRRILARQERTITALKSIRWLVVALSVMAIVWLAGSAHAQPGTTWRVSVSSAGQQGNWDSEEPSVSADGRFVAFESRASNLVPGDTNGKPDVFVHDRQTGQTTRVSVSSAGLQGNDHSFEPSISADGRFVAFYSIASNLVSGDTNGTDDVFVHQYGSGASGAGGGNQGGGNTVGDLPLRDRQGPRNENIPKPIVLVNGLSVTDTFTQFLGTTNGQLQWDHFKTVLVSLHGHIGYSVYDPATNPNGNIFICDTLNTFFGIDFNATRLNNYLSSISGASAFMHNHEFDIVGFSMGGLIARRWEQKYDKAVSPGRDRYNVTGKRLGNIVTIATPHLGSPLADLLVRASHGAVMPSVYDLTTFSALRFNLFNRGLPGTRYSQIGAQRPLIFVGHDGAVPNYSSRSKTWVSPGFQGANWLLQPFAHIHLPGLGLVGVLHDMDSVTAAYDAIYGSATLRGEIPDFEQLRPALLDIDTLLPNELIQRQVPVAIGTNQASFSGKWAEGSASLTLIEPGGRVIDPTTAKSDPNIEYSEFGGFTASYHVQNPIPGDWQLKLVGGPDVPGKGVFCELAMSDDANAVAIPASPRLVRLGEGARFLVELRTPTMRLLGGTVTTTLIRPDGTVLPLQFFDDGSHGDGAPNDGLFGSPIVSGKEPGAYMLLGRITGGLNWFGQASRTFTASFDASPETARILNVKGFRPLDDPGDGNDYYDILNVDINLQINAPGSYTLAGELLDSQGNMIDAVSEPFAAAKNGPSVQTLSFRGAVIGEHDKDGPYTVANVSLTEENELPILTDFVQSLAVSASYSRLQFETIHPRTVAPTGSLRQGWNLMSFPLDPLPPYRDHRVILGPNALPWMQSIPLRTGSLPFVRRGPAYWVLYIGPPPTTVAYLGTEDDYEFEIPLATAGEHRIGCPYNRPLPLSRALVRHNGTGQVRTAAQDAGHAEPWLNWDWLYYEEGNYRSLRLSGGDDDHLRPWFGYIVNSKVGNLTLILRD